MEINLLERLKSCVRSVFSHLSSFFVARKGRQSRSVFGSQHLATLIPHHLTELNLFRLNIPLETQMAVVQSMASMPRLRCVRSVHSLAHLYEASREDIPHLNAVAKALSVAARKMTHLLFVSDHVSAVGGDISFVDMPDCVDITLWADDFAEHRFVLNWKDDAPSVALERLLAAVPAHLRSSPPRLFWEYAIPDNENFYWSPLHQVCRFTKNVEPFLKLWSAKGWPVDIEDSEGSTPLSYVRDIASFDLLVAAGADPFYRSAKTGNNVLFCSMQWCNGNVTTIEYIMHKYAERRDPSLFVDGRGNGLLHCANRDMLKMLLDKFKSYLIPCLKNYRNRSALFSTLVLYSDAANSERIKLLLELGIDPFEPDCEGYTVIHRCLTVDFLHLPLIYVDLIKTRQDLERVWIVNHPSGVGSDKITFAMRLCACYTLLDTERDDWEPIVNRILMMCTTEELNAVDCFDRTLLHHCITALSGPAIALVDFLSKRFERRNELNFDAGSEPLMFTAARSCYRYGEVYEVLVEAGLDINGPPHRGECLLHYAIRRWIFHTDYSDVMQSCDVLFQLLDHGFDVARSDDKSGLTALHLVCFLAASQPDTFNFLFKDGPARKFLSDLLPKSKAIVGKKMQTSRGMQDVVDILLSSQTPTAAQVFILVQVLYLGLPERQTWKGLILQSAFAKVPAVRKILDRIPSLDEEEDDEDDNDNDEDSDNDDENDGDSESDESDEP
jgi:ankyrin repeat protein